MSSTDGSDDEFESADEEFGDNRPTIGSQSGHQLKDIKTDIIEDIKPKIENIKITDKSDISSDIPSMVNSSDIPSMVNNEITSSNLTKANESNVKPEPLKTDRKVIQKKPIIQGRKILRKGDRLNAIKITKFKPEIVEQLDTKPIEDIESESISSTKTDEREPKVTEVLETKTEEIKSEEQKPFINEIKDIPEVHRPVEQMINKEEEVSEEKKNEVLNRFSEISVKNTSKWNEWFSDIKSAAITATSTTVGHVSQASKNLSFDPKSLLSSAATITSNVGTGISSVVENVSSVVDSAIGAPPPEQMAAMVSEDKKIYKKTDLQSTEDCDQNPVPNESSGNKSGFGFGLFDYTLNTLESIGKKTMDVIIDDNNRFNKKK